MGKRATPEGRIQQLVSLLQPHPRGLTTHEIAERLGVGFNTAASAVRDAVRAGLLDYHPGVSVHPTGKARHLWYALETPRPAQPPRSHQKRLPTAVNPLDTDDGWLTAAKAAVAERRQFATQRAHV